MTKEPRVEPKPIDPEKWTDKQLSTVRRDCVNIALELRKLAEVDVIATASAMFEFIKDGKMPSSAPKIEAEEWRKIERGEWKFGQPHQDRVVKEQIELQEKLEKLDRFIKANTLFSTLSGMEQGRLRAQNVFMAGYNEILKERIGDFK